MTGALNDTTLMEYMERGKQIVRPFSKESLQPASIDLRLGCETYKYNLTGLTLGEDIEDSNIERDKFERRDMAPGETAFIGTYEEIMIPKDCLGVIFPRSETTSSGCRSRRAWTTVRILAPRHQVDHSHLCRTQLWHRRHP